MYCFSVRNFYCTLRDFVGACQGFISFCSNLCFVKIIFQEKLFLTKSSNLDKLILRLELFVYEPKLSSID